MTDGATYGSLPPELQKLVQLFAEIGFGRIENLWVHDARPTWDPKPMVYRELKIGRTSKVLPRHKGTDYVLKKEVLQLLELLEELKYGVIRLIVIKHGLPFKVVVEED